MSGVADTIPALAGMAASAASNVAWIAPVLMAALAYFNYDLLDPDARPVNVQTRLLYPEYDFIIVGGGSAGAVLANRLTEIENWNVLLLEAGGDETEISDVPLLAAYLQLSQLDWKYKTEPSDSACLAMKNRRCNWPRGKVIGGSSVLNYMLYVRGNKKDYAHWESLGNPGWGPAEALYYFKKSEDNMNPYLSRSPFHGTGGYLTITEAPWHTPLAAAFVQAGEEMGYPNRDINGEFQTGFMVAQATLRRGARCSTAKSFLRPARLRPNLHIAMHSHVTRVLINPKTKIAYGVEFSRDEKINIVRARKEVILSAGSINSPQILMLSGIGPKSDLLKLSIPVIQDLKVGHNLQDHVGLGGFTFLINEKISIVQDRIESVPSVLKYAMLGDGPLTVPGGVEALAFVNTKYANETEDYPDIEFHLVSGSTNSDGGVQIRKAHGLTDEFYENVFAPINNQDVWSAIPVLLRPKSRGFIKLRSKNPFDYPVIIPNYFKENIDIKVLTEGVENCAGDEQDEDDAAVRLEAALPAVPGLRASAHVYGRLLGVHDPPLLLHHLPPGGHGQDGALLGPGRRRRPPAPGLRHQRSPGHRRLHHAHPGQRQHQRPHHHDRREGRRPRQGVLVQRLSACTAIGPLRTHGDV
ncbi:unnamed protein product [Bemisia tabaci]|uniref:Glucose-methanol-choline oxidoreductase N-terminal domain-containing protein n=1 Tax=Bemisia tabaci TaxID=7038 RepID=A0A9P0AL74_BEMTA|nr:unnamed protein product [Bemisia tabaci]